MTQKGLITNQGDQGWHPPANSTRDWQTVPYLRDWLPEGPGWASTAGKGCPRAECGAWVGLIERSWWAQGIRPENWIFLIPSTPESCLIHQVPLWFIIQSPSPSGTSVLHFSLTWIACCWMHACLNAWTLYLHMHMPRPVCTCLNRCAHGVLRS